MDLGAYGPRKHLILARCKSCKSQCAGEVELQQFGARELSEQFDVFTLQFKLLSV
jgi:hypothetical protein